ncbi:unnamed protein product [Rhizophagus irregularis]|nr:unnamed protein product [Rhizophagus irregularis]
MNGRLPINSLFGVPTLFHTELKYASARSPALAPFKLGLARSPALAPFKLGLGVDALQISISSIISKCGRYWNCAEFAYFHTEPQYASASSTTLYKQGLILFGTVAS